MAGASVASSGLGILGAIGQQNAQAQAVKTNNNNVLLNMLRANSAASAQYADYGRQFTYDAKSAQQEAQAATMAGRANIGTGLASAGSSGFSGSSLTVGAVMADEQRRIAENEGRYAAKVDDMKSAYNSKVKSVEANAQDRTNSMSYQTPPSGMSLGLNIANSLVGGLSGVAKAYS